MIAATTKPRASPSTCRPTLNEALTSVPRAAWRRSPPFARRTSLRDVVPASSIPPPFPLRGKVSTPRRQPPQSTAGVAALRQQPVRPQLEPHAVRARDPGAPVADGALAPERALAGRLVLREVGVAHHLLDDR